MWTRKELKDTAKAALKRNYWKILLVSLLLALILGEGAGTAGGAGGAGAGGSVDEAVTEFDAADAVSSVTFAPLEKLLSDSMSDSLSDSQIMMAAFGILAVALLIVLIVLAAACAAQALLWNPLEIGMRRFMLRSVDDKAEVREVAYAFDHSYKNVAKTMFFRDLYTFLWTLLFIIPGVYVSYQYRLVPYILAETPDMEYKAVLQRSKEQMNGHKWKAFVLDLSFILWKLLSVITCGIVGIFYVTPYKYLTDAALYRAICGKGKEEDFAETPVIEMINADDSTVTEEEV